MPGTHDDRIEKLELRCLVLGEIIGIACSRLARLEENQPDDRRPKQVRASAAEDWSFE